MFKGVCLQLGLDYGFRVSGFSVQGIGLIGRFRFCDFASFTDLTTVLKQILEYAFLKIECKL